MKDQILYFSYGANMSTQKLAQRGILPESPGIAAIVTSQQYERISFCHRGAFASLVANTLQIKPQQEEALTYGPAHGVLYKLRRKDLQNLEKAETGYYSVALKVQPSDSSEHEACAFVSKPSLTLKGPLKPTKRYLDLLIRGACEHSLQPDYISWLQHLEVHEGGPLGKEYFDTPSAIFANLALIVVAATILYVFLH